MELHKRGRDTTILINAKKLNGVHPDLITLINIASRECDLYVLEGVRNIKRQKLLVARGSSKTMNSKHLLQTDGFSHAVDVAPWVDTDGDGDMEISWAWPDYHVIAPIIKQVSDDLGIGVTWGGDWKTFKDGPHWQLTGD